MIPLDDKAIGADAGLDRKETAGEIFQMLNGLPKNQREVIYLKFQCDLSYKEISEITRLSVTNVGFLIHAAVRAIRKQMLPEAQPAIRRMQCTPPELIQTTRNGRHMIMGNSTKP